jgi:hypothetical protein
MAFVTLSSGMPACEVRRTPNIRGCCGVPQAQYLCADALVLCGFLVEERS